jgi:predicted secreted hydrolase
VEPVVADQRMDTSVRYWEGMVVVLNSAGERVGRGYLELTGYESAAEAHGSDDEG